MIIGKQIPIHGVGRKVTVVSYTPPTGRGKEFPLGLSYSSVGFDINPFDINYRSDTKEDYFVDLGYSIAKLSFSYYSGGTDRFLIAGGTLIFEALGR